MSSYFRDSTLAYELWQCYRVENMAYEDILGHLVGLAMVGLLWSAKIVVFNCIA